MSVQANTKIKQDDLIIKRHDIIRKVDSFPEINTIIFTKEFLHGFIYLVLRDSRGNGFGGLCMSIQDFKNLEKQLKSRVKFIER